MAQGWSPSGHSFKYEARYNEFRCDNSYMYSNSCQNNTPADLNRYKFSESVTEIAVEQFHPTYATTCGNSNQHHDSITHEVYSILCYHMAYAVPLDC
jgi:hypothetical protein